MDAVGEHYRSFFSANPHPAFWLDRDGNYLASNPAGAAISGYSESELCQMTFLDVIHGDDLPQVLAAFGEVLEGGHRTVDARMRHRDGRVFDLAITAVPVVERGEVVGVHGVAEDVTERNDARRRLAESQAALRQATAEARAIKAAFVANVNHEVRTPLTSVLGYLELLGETDLEPCQQTFVETISRSSQRLLHLVDELLDYGALEAGTVQLAADPFDPRRIAAGATRRVADLAERDGIELHCAIDEAVPARVVGDAGRLEQVLGDLLDNAVKFTDEGRVDLEVGLVPAVELGASASGEGRTWLRFEVRDTGIGIPADQRVQLFEAFSQGDATMTRRHGGAGLGLAVARQMVTLMGGSITVDSVVGHGSTFRVDVPLG
nr:ATP-binding protein [Nocardioides perillae]